MIAGPGRDEIAAFWDAPTHQPVRIYVGLTASETVEERAKLAFDELRRVGGFGREYLILATPTGSAWLDPGAMDTLEYMSTAETKPATWRRKSRIEFIRVISCGSDPKVTPSRVRALRELLDGG